MSKINEFFMGFCKVSKRNEEREIKVHKNEIKNLWKTEKIQGNTTKES